MNTSTPTESPTKPAGYNYYQATFSAVTVKRARRMGVVLPGAPQYGYAVLIYPPVMSEGRSRGAERVQAWCKTKAIATSYVGRAVNYQEKGYYGCPCGSNEQARVCCGIPQPFAQMTTLEFVKKCEDEAYAALSARVSGTVHDRIVTLLCYFNRRYGAVKISMGMGTWDFLLDDSGRFCVDDADREDGEDADYGLDPRDFEDYMLGRRRTRAAGWVENDKKQMTELRALLRYLTDAKYTRIRDFHYLDQQTQPQ